MVNTDDYKIMSFKTSNDLNIWLIENHDSENELWIRIYKKRTGITSITWKQVVIEVLCWGWIDGIKKSFDEQSYIQRISPRRNKSTWSKINTKLAENLIIEKRMKEPGFVQIRMAKEDGRWGKAYSTSEMEVPLDFLESLDSRPIAKEFYNTLTKSKRFIIAYGLSSAKKSETRIRRFEKYINLLERKEIPK